MVMWPSVSVRVHQVRDRRLSEDVAVRWSTIHDQFGPADASTTIDALTPAPTTTPSDATKNRAARGQGGEEGSDAAAASVCRMNHILGRGRG